jgi:hypothetical protein
MSDVQTLRRLALALPEVVDASQGKRLAFEVAGKGIAWSFLVRPSPREPRAPKPGQIAIRCALERKEVLLEAAPDRFFDDPHYQGFPAVLVHLEAVDEDELAHLLYEAWRLQAPKGVQTRHTL